MKGMGSCSPVSFCKNLVTDLNSHKHLNKVNEYRRMKKYKDEGAAMEVFKMIENEELTNSPFVREFNYGMNFDGYWGYHHMVL